MEDIMPNQIAECLRTSAEVINERGLVKNRAAEIASPCLTSAMAIASGGDANLFFAAKHFFQKYLGNRNLLVLYSDTPDRTKEDVMADLNDAAKQAEAVAA
jgi:hypothetical protein